MQYGAAVVQWAADQHFERYHVALCLHITKSISIVYLYRKVCVWGGGRGGGGGGG